MEQVYGGKEEWMNHFNYLLPFFRDERYIKIDNKPVVNIYRSYEIDQLAAMKQVWDTLAKQNGFDGVYLVAGNTTAKRDTRSELFDAYYNYEPGNTLTHIENYEMAPSTRVKRKVRKILNVISNRKHVWHIEEAKRFYRHTTSMPELNGKKCFLGTFAAYDDTPRRQYEGLIVKSSPNQFYENLIGIKKKLQSLGMREGSSLMTKRIGTITFHRADNYGAVLQAYALQQALLNLGVDTEIIDYDCKAISDWYQPIHHSGSIRDFVKSLLMYPTIHAKHKGFDAFRSMFLKLSPPVEKVDLPSFAKRYDAVVTGSDQVWNSMLVQHDSAYFLDFVKPEQRFSYAASFGISEIPAEEREFYRKYLSDYRHYSTREATGARLVKEITGQDADVDLDPVFLLGREGWEKILHDVNHRPYLFLYLPTPQCLEFAKKLAAERHLTIVYIAYTKSLLNRKRNLGELHIDASPEDFLSFLYHSEVVVTGSFHATAFSVIFHKEFYAGVPDRIGSRITDLLSMVNLSHCILQLDREVKKKPDWERVDAEVKERRQVSIRHLSESLGLV